MFNAVTGFSQTADATSTWFLGAAGAAAALYLPSIERVASVLGTAGARVTLALLAISVFSGLQAKRLGVRVQFQRALMDGLLRDIPAVYDEFTPRYDHLVPGMAHQIARADFSEVQRDVLEAVPWFLRWRFKRSAEKGGRDPLLTFKQAASRFGWQMMLMTIQHVTFVAALAAAIFFL
jgi:hypothetical protein